LALGIGNQIPMTLAKNA